MQKTNGNRPEPATPNIHRLLDAYATVTNRVTQGTLADSQYPTTNGDHDDVALLQSLSLAVSAMCAEYGRLVTAQQLAAVNQQSDNRIVGVK